MSLHVLAYCLKRLIAILGLAHMMDAIKAFIHLWALKAARLAIGVACRRGSPIKRYSAVNAFERNDVFFKKSKNVEPLDGTAAAVFWGASDRMICCTGIGGETVEFNTSSHPKLAQQGYVATLEIQNSQGEPALLLHAFYSGHWSFAVSPGSEDTDELPNWKMTREWGSVNQHSETLTIFCPNGCKVSAVDRIADHY